MCIDHLIYDMTSFGVMSYLFDLSKFNYFTNIADKYYFSNIRYVIMYVVLFLLFILVGINCSNSRNNHKRGKKYLNIALAISLISYICGLIISNRNVFISFGVIHAISLSILICDFMLKKTNNKYIYLILGLLSCSIGCYLKYFINGGVITYSYGALDMPEIILRQILGLCMFGLDSFSLLIVLGQVMIGIYLSKVINIKDKLYKYNLFSFMGKYSIYFYFGSQIICVFILTIALSILSNF